MDLEFGQIVTQIIGFLIALWLLKKFAWKPLLGMLEQRRTKIKSEFASIDKEKDKMEKLVSDYETKLKEIDSLTRIKLQEAAKEGQKMATEIRENARNEASAMISRAKEELQREVDKAKIQLRDEMVAMTMKVTEKMISERLDQEKHKKLISDFIDELEKIK
jgi:F-type H+-transporting ATPase subunit b